MFGCKIISNILTVSLPPDLIVFGIHDRVGERTHAFIVSAIWLHEVGQMQPICLPFASVLDTKVVPLAVALCIVIVFAEQLVFKGPNFHGFA